MARSSAGLGLSCVLCASWVAVAVVAAPRTADAQASFTAQDRSVDATSRSLGGLWDILSSPFFPDFDPPTTTFEEVALDSASAPDLTPFSATASTVDPPLLAVSPDGSASATQTSTLTPSLIDAAGSFSLVGHSRTLTQQELDLANAFLNPPIPYGLGLLDDEENGGSSFSVDFDVALATPYSLTGSLGISPVEFADGLFPITAASAAITLSGGPQGLLVFASIAQEGLCDPGPCTGDTLDVQGVLQPGSYTLTAHADGSAQGLCIDIVSFTCHTPTASGSFDLTLALSSTPVPALPPMAVPLAALLLGGVGTVQLRRASARRR